MGALSVTAVTVKGFFDRQPPTAIMKKTTAESGQNEVGRRETAFSITIIVTGVTAWGAVLLNNPCVQPLMGLPRRTFLCPARGFPVAFRFERPCEFL